MGEAKLFVKKLNEDRIRYEIYCKVGYTLPKSRDYLELLLRFQQMPEKDRIRFESMYINEFDSTPN